MKLPFGRQGTLPFWLKHGGSAVVLLWLGSGCVSAPVVPMRPERYRIEVRLDPHQHWLEGRAAIDLVRAQEQPALARGPVAVGFLLHPDLKVSAVHAGGATMRSSWTTRISRPPDWMQANENQAFSPRRHWVYLAEPVEAMTLFVDYSGRLEQNAAEGEQAGEIHNFEMRAHVGREGVYLSDGLWYPRPELPDDQPVLAEFTLIAEPIDGLELVASAERRTSPAALGAPIVWKSPFPVPELVLVGGPHEIREVVHNGVTIAAHLKPSQTAFADGLISAARDLLDRYEPLIGPYPARQYRVVDNFFSSGFAFPTFTLLSSPVIEMGERSQRTHGYLDHELLHSWWGNAIHVDPRDGNWCEALASYGANYYGFILDGNEDEARRKRRNFSHFLSRIQEEDDLPLGTYGRPGGCGRSIAYQKGAAVFHMLSQKIGEEQFWAAMRRLTAQFVGRFASWDDIRHACEAESGQDLNPFFDQWVRRGGAPQLAVESARFDTADESLNLVFTQTEPPFLLDVPLHIRLSTGTSEIKVVSLSGTRQEVALPFSGQPRAVALDPDYHLFRKIPTDQILPTTASTRFGSAFTCVLPARPIAPPLKTVQSIFADSFEPDEQIERVVGNIEGTALAERCVLILGAAVRDPYVAAFLSAVEFPVRWNEVGFEFDGVDYTDPEDAVLCTIRHPGVRGGGITAVFSNSDGALPSPWAVPMFEHSVVVFKDGKPVVRQDFEPDAAVQVESY